MTTSKSKRMLAVDDAAANLVEVLRLAEDERPQYIEPAGTFVVTPAEPEAIPGRAGAYAGALVG